MPLSPELGGLLWSLVASGVYDLLKHAGARALRAVHGQDAREWTLARAQDDRAVRAALQTAARELAEALAPADASPEAWRRADRMKGFLAAPEAVTFAQTLFLVATDASAEDGGEQARAQVRRDLEASLALYLRQSVAEVQDVLGPLYDGLSRVARQVISVAIREGVLAAHEAASAERHRALAAGPTRPLRDAHRRGAPGVRRAA
jgi:hypothetical protein